MSNDGATYGITAEQALSGVLGGDEIPEDAHQTREQVRARLDATPRLAEIHMRVEHGNEVLYYRGKELVSSYGEAADIAARAILDFIETHPEHEDAPGDNEYDHAALMAYNGEGDFPKPIKRGVYELMKDAGYDLGKLGLSGFQWGFAYNLARWLRYEEGEGNPAIIEVGQ